MSAKELPFIIESAPSRKGPWVRSGGGRCFEKAKEAYRTAQSEWARTGTWVRVRHINGKRAVNLFCPIRRGGVR